MAAGSNQCCQGDGPKIQALAKKAVKVLARRSREGAGSEEHTQQQSAAAYFCARSYLDLRPPQEFQVSGASVFASLGRCLRFPSSLSKQKARLGILSADAFRGWATIRRQSNGLELP